MIKLIMTLLVRDEADIVRDNIEFHLKRGVDFVVATDNGSRDGTREILSDYQKQGVLHFIDEPALDYFQWKWVTRMAHIARERFGADWLVNSDADEFWYPDSGNLKTELSGLQEHVLECGRWNMMSAHDREVSSWRNSLIYRVKKPESIPNFKNPLRDPLPKPYLYFDLPPKVVCRAKGLVKIHQGNHSAEYSRTTKSVSGNIHIYHYPIRGRRQFERKVRQGGAAYERNTKLSPAIGWHWRRWYALLKKGDLESAFEETLPSFQQLQDDLRRGSVVVDRRMREKVEADRQDEDRGRLP